MSKGSGDSSWSQSTSAKKQFVEYKSARLKWKLKYLEKELSND